MSRGASINAQDHSRYIVLDYASSGERAWGTYLIFAYGAGGKTTFSVSLALHDAGT